MPPRAMCRRRLTPRAGNCRPTCRATPYYRKSNPADSPVLILALTSDMVDRARMYDVASSILQQKLSQVEGVGRVVVGGGALPAVRVEVNPTILHSYGLSLEDVRAALNGANANRPKGEIADDSGRTWTINTTDQLLQATEYQPLIISYKQGAAVRLADVADGDGLGLKTSAIRVW